MTPRLSRLDFNSDLEFSLYEAKRMEAEFEEEIKKPEYADLIKPI